MGIFSGPKEKDELALVFDIGSSSVGGALFWTQKSGIPKIIFSIREPIALEEELNIDRFLSLTLQSLGVVANKFHKAGLGAPKKIFCVLSSPWYVSQTRKIRLEKNTPFTFTSKLADSLIQKEINIFEEERLADYVRNDSKVRVIEIKSIKTILNGYTTDQPLNQKTKEVEITVFISISPEQILDKMANVISQHFKHKDMEFSSFVITSLAVTQSVFTDQEDFLLVDIGGEMTDISMIKKNVLRESISFPIGPNFIIRGVASVLHCTLDEAKSLISLHKDGHMDYRTKQKLEPVISELKKYWLKKFQESLANLSNDISMPATIFVTVDQDLEDFFSETIQTEQFSQYTLTESKFKVTFLNPQALHGIAFFKENIIRDPFLIIESIYINHYLLE